MAFQFLTLITLFDKLCEPCYMADLAKQQQAKGRRCSGCGVEGKMLTSGGLCWKCSKKQKAEAAQRAPVEEYMAAAKEDANNSCTSEPLYL